MNSFWLRKTTPTKESLSGRLGSASACVRSLAKLVISYTGTKINQGKRVGNPERSRKVLVLQWILRYFHNKWELALYGTKFDLEHKELQVIYICTCLQFLQASLNSLVEISDRRVGSSQQELIPRQIAVYYVCQHVGHGHGSVRDMNGSSVTKLNGKMISFLIWGSFNSWLLG